MLNKINTDDLRNVSGGKNSGAKFISVTLALLAGVGTNLSADEIFPKEKTSQFTVELEERLLNQELSRQEKKSKTGKTSVLLKLGRDAVNISVTALVSFLIQRFRDKNNLNQSRPRDTVPERIDIDLQILVGLYERVSSCPEISINKLDPIQQSNAVTFACSLICKIDSELHFFTTSGTDPAKFVKNFLTTDANQLPPSSFVLQMVGQYLGLESAKSTRENLDESENILESFREKLPTSPLAKIIEGLANSKTNVDAVPADDAIDEDQTYGTIFGVEPDLSGSNQTN